MSLSIWLSDLARSGRVWVPPPPFDFEPADVAAAQEILVGMDAAARLDAPFDAPPLSIDCAGWAAVLMYGACQFLVYRDVDEALVRAMLGAPARTRRHRPPTIRRTWFSGTCRSWCRWPGGFRRTTRSSWNC